MPAPQIIFDLVSRFSQHIETYKSGSYNETHLRRDFLDPFFKALGWDVDNEQGYAEAYRDVLHEDHVRVGTALKAPDYGFCIGGQRKFFLEAKKPSVRIKDDINPAFQLRRYAWSAKLPLSILSDFEELAVYDCRIKPILGDSASKARIFYYTFEQYNDKWDEIYGIFSKEAILKGSFDKFAAAAKGKRGTAEVDADFLATIEGWRADLARNLALRNPSLSQRELNFAVQRVLDRIIFLRICEDRGIEDYHRLRNSTEGKGPIYPRLVSLFKQADARYNSGLFHFRSEKARHEEHDSLTPSLVIDDDLLKSIILGLYYPDSPYEFSVLSADILGQVYEQFLGKVIRLTDKHQAKIEDKPEVRKAGGVFYTPTYIVNYIIRQTIAPLINGKTPKQIATLRVLDPSCGSGSFLISAYQFLLDWYYHWYSTNTPEKWAKGKNPPLVARSRGGWALNTSERKRILLAHIYGVDIDSQAVEVTKLSLLLKVLEGETAQTVQRELIQERVLPDLGDNIKCGNSLISSDFYAQSSLPEMDTEDHLHINVFDWDGKDGFPEIMKAGGFDVVIGNPPYLRTQGLQEYYGNQIDYFNSKYESAAKRFDLYMLFLERGYRLLSSQGYLGFICPHKFTNGDFATNLRGFLVREKAIKRLLSFGHNMVFSQASTYTGIVSLSRDNSGKFLYAEMPEIDNVELQSKLFSYTAPEAFTSYNYSDLSSAPWPLTSGTARSLLKKLNTLPHTIGSVFSDVLVGVQSGIDDVHILRDDGQKETTNLNLYSERESKTVQVERDLTKIFAMGDEVHRYAAILPRHRCIYPYRLEGDKTLVLKEDELRSKFPLGYSYLSRHQNYLTEIRERQKTNPVYWYSCHRSRDMKIFEKARIVTPEISKGCNFSLAPAGLYHNTQVYSLVPAADRHENQLFWLGILNSKVLWWFLTQTGTVLRGGFFRFKTNYLRPFPLRVINPANKSDQTAHDRIVALVEKMLTLNRQHAAAKTPHEQTALVRQISAADIQIDREVYSLYGLTQEEIRTVEGN